MRDKNNTSLRYRSFTVVVGKLGLPGSGRTWRKRSPKPDKGAEFAVLLGFIWKDAMSLGFRTSWPLRFGL